jgi:hypothetical protein
MDIKRALLETISVSLTHLDKKQYGEIAPGILLDEYLTLKQTSLLESDEQLGAIWRFIDSFFDAAAHEFPNVSENLELEDARIVVEEMAAFLKGQVTSLSEHSKKILEEYY